MAIVWITPGNGQIFVRTFQKSEASVITLAKVVPACYSMTGFWRQAQAFCKRLCL